MFVKLARVPFEELSGLHALLGQIALGPWKDIGVIDLRSLPFLFDLQFELDQFLLDLRVYIARSSQRPAGILWDIAIWQRVLRYLAFEEHFISGRNSLHYRHIYLL